MLWQPYSYGIKILNTPGMTEVQLGNKSEEAMWYAFPNFLAKLLTCICTRKDMIYWPNVFCITELLTGQIWTGRNFLDFYSGDTRFEYRPRHELSWLRIFVTFLTSSKPLLGLDNKWGYDLLLSYPFNFISPLRDMKLQPLELLDIWRWDR